ncbi:MAG: hypothetical protein RLZZ70_128 [Candidatus Parcubacteria bacterium]|jgi:competence protein ComEC
MQQLLFYVVVLGFAGGVLLRSFLFMDVYSIVLLVLVAFGLVLLWRQATSQKNFDHVTSVVLIGGVGIFCVALGMLRFLQAEVMLDDTQLARLVGTEVVLEGVIVREPDVRANQVLLTVKTEDTAVLVSTDRYTTVQYGDVVSVSGTLLVPESFTTDLGRTFDYVGYLRARGITHSISFASVTVIGTETPIPGVASLYTMKQLFLERLALVIPEPEVALGAGLLLGVQSALGEELEEAFRTTGIIHIVVLSGYNIMLVVAFVLFVLSFVLAYRWRLVVGIVAIIVFALLVGYSPSVMRASLMAMLFLFVALLARPYLIMRMLLLAGVLMLVWNPYLLRYDIGFQLSFMATLGLILVAPHLEAAWLRVTAWLSIRSFLVATVATQIAVAPLLLYHMGEWSLVAVPVNLLVLPMVPVAMLLTFITGLLALVSPVLAMPVGALASASLTYIITIAKTVATLPFAAVSVPPFSGLFVPLAYVVLGALWYHLTHYQSRKGQGTLIEPGETTMGEHYDTWEVVPESLISTKAPLVSQPYQFPKSSLVQKTKTAVSSDKTVKADDDVPIFFR